MNFDKLENGSRKTKSVVEVLRIKQEEHNKHPIEQQTCVGAPFYIITTS